MCVCVCVCLCVSPKMCICVIYNMSLTQIFITSNRAMVVGSIFSRCKKLGKLKEYLAKKRTPVKKLMYKLNRWWIFSSNI